MKLGPTIGSFKNDFGCAVHLRLEISGSLSTSLRIPLPSLLEITDRFRQDFKRLTAHFRLPSFACGLLPTARAWIVLNRRPGFAFRSPAPMRRQPQDQARLPDSRTSARQSPSALSREA